MSHLPSLQTLRAFEAAGRLKSYSKAAEELGLTQEDLAEKAGIHRTYLSDIERGTRNLSLLNIERLADALHLRLSELFLLVE